MVNRYLFICIVMLTAQSLLWGQEQNIVQEINKIKANTGEYIYAESTCATWEEALDNAKYLLGVEIETWAKTHGEVDAAGYVAKAQNSLVEMKSMRGDRFRAFVYVNIKDIFSYKSNNQIVVVPVDASNASSITAMTPQKSQQAEYPGATTAEPQKNVFEQEILSITDAKNIEPYITNLSKNGKIDSFGKYKDIPAQGDCYLFVYDREMTVSAHLKRVNNNFINIQNGKNDDIKNYKGCGAIWFKIK